jgi:uncharacterized membrane protein
MPPYFFQMEVWKALWPMPFAAIVLSFVIVLIAGNRGERRELLIVLTSFSMLGIVTGYLTGFSREPAVGAVLPAVLSLLGGLTVFVVGKSRENRGMVSLTMFVFSLMLLLGSSWGAVMRDVAEEYERSERFLAQQVYIEAQVNEFRRELGLSPLDKGKSSSKAEDK